MNESRALRAGARAGVVLVALLCALAGTVTSTGAWFTARTVDSGNRVGTAVLQPVIAQTTVGTDLAVTLNWPAAPTGGEPSHFLVTREVEGEPSSKTLVYQGNGTTVTDRGAGPAELADGQAGGFSKVAAGNNHSCAIARGKAYCWGRNESGQLGDGTTTASQRPVPVVRTAMSGQVTDISVGFAHTCAIADATVYCWGNNNDGRLGNGSWNWVPSQVPARVEIPGKVTDISAGYRATCAIADGAGYCWGSAVSGQLGNGQMGKDAWGNERHSTTPQRVQGGLLPAGARFTSISTGTAHSCGVALSQAYCWGSGADGQLGSSGVTGSAAPVLVFSLLSPVTEIVAGRRSTCAASAPVMYCWGTGGPVPGTAASPPVQVSSTWFAQGASSLEMGRVDEGAVSNDHACAVASRSVVCWGDNVNGVLGRGSPGVRSTTPAPVDADLGIPWGVATGGRHTCVMKESEVRCWGSSDGGGLGDGTGQSSSTPVSTAPIRDWTCAPGALLQPAVAPATRPTCSFAAGTRLVYRIDQWVGRWTAPTGITGVRVAAPS